MLTHLASRFWCAGPASHSELIYCEQPSKPITQLLTLNAHVVPIVVVNPSELDFDSDNQASIRMTSDAPFLIRDASVTHGAFAMTEGKITDTSAQFTVALDRSGLPDSLVRPLVKFIVNHQSGASELITIPIHVSQK